MDTIFGLPVHPLLVHATVVVLPLAALAVGLAALWPRFRSRAAAAPLALSAVAVALVPLSVQSGEALSERVDETALVDTHRNLGDDMLVWAIGLAVASLLLYWLHRRDRNPDPTGASMTPRSLTLAVALIAVAAAVGSMIHVVRVGHSGSEAAWSDVPEARP